jgi:hypothetical protein
MRPRGRKEGRSRADFRGVNRGSWVGSRDRDRGV